MSIITLSRDPYSHGEEIAAKVAKELGYSCLGSDFYKTADAPEQREHFDLLRSMMDSGVVGKKKDVALFRSMFFENMLKDNVVYHGAAGHLLLQNIPNVLKVHVVADFEDRVNEFIRRTGKGYDQAKSEVMRHEATRREWARRVHHGDENETYDLSVNLHNMSVDAAAKIIADAARAAMVEQGANLQKILGDLAMAARMEATLLDHFSEAQVEIKNGEAFIRVEASVVQEEAAGRKVRKLLAGNPEIKEMYVGVIPSMYVPF